MRIDVSFLVALSLVFCIACGEVEDFFNKLGDVNEEVIDLVDPTENPNTTTTSSSTTTTVLPDSTNPICNKIYGTDGAGGFLWKPVSESNGNVAVQLPAVFATKFDSCEAHGQHIYGPLSFAKFANWDGQDRYKRDRQLWRGQLPGSSYGGPVSIICKQPTQECMWQISDGSIRND